MVGGRAMRGRKGRLAMSMVIPIHKGPDAVSRKMSSIFCRTEIMNARFWIFREKGNWEFIHASHCSNVLQGGVSLKTDAVENCKRKFYVVAKIWQQLNERFNQISRVSPICILDVEIKFMFSILNAGHVIQIFRHCSFWKCLVHPTS